MASGTAAAPASNHTFARRWGWLAALILTLATMNLLRQQGAPLLGPLPLGILSLEVPATAARARELFDALGDHGRAIAVRQVQLDYVFLLLYPLAFAMALVRLAPLASGRIGRWCATLARRVWLAGLFDAIENAAMLRMLAGATGSPWPEVSTACAAVKFAIVAVALLALLAALASWAKRGGRAVQR